MRDAGIAIVHAMSVSRVCCPGRSLSLLCPVTDGPGPGSREETGKPRALKTFPRFSPTRVGNLDVMGTVL